MRIVHMADTHLGFQQLHRIDENGRNIREQDVYDAFERAIAVTVELQPAGLIHAGDLFDSYHPTSAALRVALDGFAQLKAAGIPIVIIAGNHSTPRGAAAEHVFGVLERFGGVHLIHGDTRTIRVGDLAVHGIPHHNDQERVTEALRQARPSPEARHNVLVAHIGLDGFGNLVGAEGSATTLPGEELVHALDFDYIALGHLHAAARVSDNAAYAGSLERLSWADDEKNRKGILEVNLDAEPDDDEYVRMHAIAGRRQFALDPIDGKAVADLTAAIVARADEAGSGALRGAMVRLTVRNVTAAAWNAIDHRAVGDAFSECLHFQRDAEFAGHETQALQSVPELHEFLLRWPGVQGTTIDTNDFIRRAEEFLSLADEEIAARESRAA